MILQLADTDHWTGSLQVESGCFFRIEDKNGTGDQFETMG